jgi:hypothetical protein
VLPVLSLLLEMGLTKKKLAAQPESRKADQHKSMRQ